MNPLLDRLFTFFGYRDEAQRQRLASIAAPEDFPPPAAGGNTPPPPTLALIDPERIHTDPATYQFRSGADARGVTEQGRFHAARWDPILHGDPLLVHERLNGELFVADGHHRLDLALRTNAQGTGPGRVAALILRERDGYTARDVKLIAAYKNLQSDLAQGHANPVTITDGARVFKEVREGGMQHPEWLPSLQMDKGDLHLAYRLSNLSDMSLRHVAKGELPADTAALIAEQVRDPGQQEVLIRSLAQNYSVHMQMYGAPVNDNGFAVTSLPLPAPKPALPDSPADIPPAVLTHVERYRQQRMARQGGMRR